MAKQAAVASPKPGPIERLKTFYEEVRAEMRKVAWPTPEELKGQTWIVSILLLILGAIVGGFDFIFGNVIIRLLSLG